MSEQASPNLFDRTAGAFAKNTDVLISKGFYRRGEIFAAAAKQHVKAGGYILDYGCGPGRIAKMLGSRGFQVKGVDTSSGMLEEARSQAGAGSVCFELIDDRNPRLELSQFDAIVCSSVIEYVPEPAQLLKVFHASLRDDGILILSYANALSLWRLYARCRFGDRLPHLAVQCNVWRWTHLRRLLDEEGFEAIAEPVYFDSPCDSWAIPKASSYAWVGTLAAVVARRGNTRPRRHD